MNIGETYYVPVGIDGRLRVYGAGTREEAQAYINDIHGSPELSVYLRIALVRVVEVEEEPAQQPNVENQQDEAIRLLTDRLDSLGGHRLSQIERRLEAIEAALKEAKA